MDHQIWDEYAATLVHITPAQSPEFVVTAAPPGITGIWPWGDAGEAWVITACNPRSDLLSDDLNAARNGVLRSELTAAGWQPVESVGRQANGDWREPGFVIVGNAGATVLDLARRHDQNAVFHWTPTEWAIHGVLQPGRRTMGWRVMSGARDADDTMGHDRTPVPALRHRPGCPADRG